MRNTFKFGLFAALATFSLACTKATVEPTVGGNEKVQMTFTATSGAVTKTYLDGKTVKWHENDVIGIHDGFSAAKDATLNQQFTVSSINSDGSASFTGTAAAGKEVYYATYPYDVNNFITEEGKMRIGFVTAQTASQPGTFDMKFNSSAAKLKDGVFNFKNVGGLLKFTLTQENVKKVTLVAKDGGTVGGVYYIYFDENGNIDDSKTTLASARTSVTLSPTGSTTFAAGTYYLVISPRTYVGGMTISFNLDNDKIMTAECTSDVVIERSKITNIGSFDTTYQEQEEVFTPVEFPVIFPLGYPEGGSTGHNAGTNAWVAEGWANLECCVTTTRTNHMWTGTNGKWLCKDQPQAYMTWTWTEAINTTGVMHYLETVNSKSPKVSSIGVKGIWTGDYFEIVLPVSNFDAGTTLQLTMPLCSRSGGPTFWEVLYKDGETWKSTAQDDLEAFGSGIKLRATWTSPHVDLNGNDDTDRTVEMTFDNGITTGEIHIKVMCPDGSVVSTADGVVENMTGPTSKNVNLTVDGQNITKEASGSFYFFNPSKRNNHSITIDILNI